MCGAPLASRKKAFFPRNGERERERERERESETFLFVFID
jgi:hypothetical protein